MKKFVLAGKSDLALKTAILLTKYDLELFIVPSKSDLTNHDWQISLEKFSEEYNINKCDSLESFKSDLDTIILSVEYDKIIDVNNFKTNQIYNVHFSYLPFYKGVYTSIFPILNNESFSGVTLHKIDNGIDSGEIIDQVKFDIFDMTSYELYINYLSHGFEIILRNIDDIILGCVKSKPQDTSLKSIYYRKDLDFSKRHLISESFNDLKYMKEVFNLLKAFYFTPYQLPTLDGKEIIKFHKIDGDFKDAANYFINSTSDLKLFRFEDGILIIQLKGLL